MENERDFISEQEQLAFALDTALLNVEDDESPPPIDSEDSIKF